ncbi:MAG: hypothetical protein ABFD89_01000 [Bryobacteraceae bacterium]
MRLSRLVIDNIKGIEHLEFQPGALTVLRGANGTGKSSVIEATMSVFSGGSDPGWLRLGAKKGSVVMEITNDDGALAATITKTVAVKRSGEGISTTLEILDPNGVPVPAPQSFIKSLGESWAVDPSSILNIDTSKAEGRKALIAKLLEIIPVRFDRNEMAGALNGLSVTGLDIAAGTDLQGIGKARAYVEEMRRRVGVEQREAENTAATLRRSLPDEAEDGVDWTAKERELEQERLALVEREASEKAEATKIATDNQATLGATFDAEEQQLREEFQKELASIKFRRYQEDERWRQFGLDKHENIRQALKPEFDRIIADQATVRAKAEAQQKAAGVRESIDTFQQRFNEKSREYLSLTSAMERLDALKKSKLEDLPAGMTFEGDQVCIDGVPWHHVNTARRYSAAFEIVGAKPGLMPFLVCDNAEHFDGDNWRDFEDAAKACGFQIIAAKVDAGPLTIEKVA